MRVRHCGCTQTGRRFIFDYRRAATGGNRGRVRAGPSPVLYGNRKMNRRQALAACVAAGLWPVAGRTLASRRAPHVVFLNPGEVVERGTGTHWQMVSRFMAAAADRFGMTLEVLYAERDHLLMLRQAEALAQRAEAPDFIILVNEKMAAGEMLEALARSPAKLLLMHNDLTDAQRRRVGNERESISNWIGTITANAERGAFRLMANLCRLHDTDEARVIGITGDPKTPVSMERAQGVASYLAQTARGITLQLAYSDWSAEDSYQKSRVLLARYPQANLLWAANDTMTLGAAKAVKEAGTAVLVGGVGALQRAVAGVVDGDIAAIVAGDYFIGAFAIVLLYDYAQGVDFAAHGGVRQKLDFLRVLDRSNAGAFLDAIFERGTIPDFARYAHALHPSTGGYAFDFLRQLNVASGDT